MGISEKTQQQLSNKYIRRSPFTTRKKLDGILPLGILGPAFVLLTPFIVRNSRGASLWPFLFAFSLGFSWCIMCISLHQSISESEYAELEASEKGKRQLYESILAFALPTGFGLFTTIACLWGVAEMGLAKELWFATSFILITFLIFACGCIVKREWIATVTIDGVRKHKSVGRVVGGVVIFAGMLPIVAGITNMMRVTLGQESLDIVVVPMMVFLTLLGTAIFVMTLIGALITQAHYHQWKYFTDTSYLN